MSFEVNIVEDVPDVNDVKIDENASLTIESFLNSVKDKHVISKYDVLSIEEKIKENIITSKIPLNAFTENKSTLLATEAINIIKTYNESNLINKPINTNVATDTASVGKMIDTIISYRKNILLLIANLEAIDINNSVMLNIDKFSNLFKVWEDDTKIVNKLETIPLINVIKYDRLDLATLDVPELEAIANLESIYETIKEIDDVNVFPLLDFMEYDDVEDTTINDYNVILANNVIKIRKERILDRLKSMIESIDAVMNQNLVVTKDNNKLENMKYVYKDLLKKDDIINDVKTKAYFLMCLKTFNQD